MAQPEYPDRADWPGYWRAIRYGLVWIAVAAIIIGLGTLLPRPQDATWRVAVEVLIALAAAAAGRAVATLVETWVARHAS